MSTVVKKRFLMLVIVYWFLLIYVLSALVWWFISLYQQNINTAQLNLSRLQPGEIGYEQKVYDILKEKKRKTAQYIGEGSIFMLVIVAGAVIVFRITKKQSQLGALQQNFMMAITHELKTPIAVAKLNLETLQKRKLDESQQQRLINNTLLETERLNDLCNNILLTSHLESGVKRFVREELDLHALVQDCVGQFRRRFVGRHIELLCPYEVAIKGEPLSLQLLLNNLLENAIKYSPKDEEVKVVVSQSGDNILLEVQDKGFGISNDEKKKIFDKFYRIGSEKTRTSKGTGLGLYLCKKIMQIHHGAITVTDNKPEGTIFTVIFKKAHN